jgi:predicted ATPase
MNTFVVISGCSGGGKSTLLAELQRRGYATVKEPGRRIVAEEIEAGGTALPWVDVEAFARRAIRMAIADRAAAPHDGRPVFFDRGLIDAASALEAMTGEPVLRPLAEAHPYHARVFLTPPWPEIYLTDAERRHGMDAAIAEYERLCRDYPALGYEVDILPKIEVAERADYVLDRLTATEPVVPADSSSRSPVAPPRRP